MILTAEQAIARAQYWQGVLRLQDWDVDVRIARRSALRAPTAVAEAVVSTYKRAIVRLCDPADYTDDDWPIERDMEASLVHELVHLHLYDLRVATLDRDGQRAPEDVAQERAIEAIARALVHLDRRTEPAQ